MNEQPKLTSLQDFRDAITEYNLLTYGEDYLMHPERLEKVLESYRDLVRRYSEPGNYDYSEYMLGFTNGLILALAVFEGTNASYLKQPDKYIKDNVD